MKNFREIAFGNMKKGMLFRSDVLYHLNPKEKGLLKANNIKTIIDLRNPKEAEELKDTNIKAIKFLNIPLLSGKNGETIQPPKTIVINNMTLVDLVFCYQEIMMENKKEAWSKIFDILLNNIDGAILFHCSAGKDRTGIVTAVILTALGIDKETIYNDYLFTNTRPLYYKKLAAQMDEKSREIFLDAYAAKTIYLDAAFNQIEKEYGSFKEFLFRCCSLDEDKLIKFRNKYLNS